MNNMLLLIDGSSLLSTHYHGNLPRELQGVREPEKRKELYHKILHTQDGKYTNAMFGMLKAVLKIIEDQKPSHMAVCWDVSRNTFRRSINSSYKGTRKDTEYPLKEQFINMQDFFREIGIPQLMSNLDDDITEIFEADDYLGSMARKFEKTIPTYILTKDNDALQLVSDHTRLWLVTSKAEDLRAEYYPEGEYNLPNGVIELTPSLVEQYKGVSPLQCIDLKALEGDTGDNISGVKGVGPKAAIPLIKEYGSIEALYDALDGLTPSVESELKGFWKNSLGISRPPIASLLKESTDSEILGKQAAFLSKELGTIKCDIPIDKNLDDFKVTILENKLFEQCLKYEFKSLLPQGFNHAESISVSASTLKDNSISCSAEILKTDMSNQVPSFTENVSLVEQTTQHKDSSSSGQLSLF